MVGDLPVPASPIPQEERTPGGRIVAGKRGQLLFGTFEVLAKTCACLVLLTEIGLANRAFQEHVCRRICGERIQRVLVAPGIQVGLPKRPQLPASHEWIEPASALDYFDGPFRV